LLIPIWNALVHEQNAVVRQESHSTLAYMIALLSSGDQPGFFRNFCLPLQNQIITDETSINLLSSILLNVIDKHEYVEIDSLALLDADLQTCLDSINSCHVYQSWSDEDIAIAQSTLSILDNPHSIRIYSILVDLAQFHINNPNNIKSLTHHIQFLIKFCTDQISSPNFNSYASAFVTLEPTRAFLKQFSKGLKTLKNFVASGTKLKDEILSKLKTLDRLLVLL
jgi:hypothetical protein